MKTSKLNKIKMHSSWMRTVCCNGRLGGGGCLPRGGVCPGGGYLPRDRLPWGCLPRGSVCLGVYGQEGCMPRGGVHLPLVNRIRDRCQNITFPQLRLLPVKSSNPLRTACSINR